MWLSLNDLFWEELSRNWAVPILLPGDSHPRPLALGALQRRWHQEHPHYSGGTSHTPTSTFKNTPKPGVLGRKARKTELAATLMAGQDAVMARLNRRGRNFGTSWGFSITQGRDSCARLHTARGHPKTPHPSPQVPPPLSPSQFPGPPYAADGCWVRGVSVGAVLASQHRRSAAAPAIPGMGFPHRAGGTTWDRRG